eukprot:1149994-Pelagomonas_calceolata.AAC.3
MPNTKESQQNVAMALCLIFERLIPKPLPSWGELHVANRHFSRPGTAKTKKLLQPKGRQRHISRCTLQSSIASAIHKESCSGKTRSKCEGGILGPCCLSGGGLHPNVLRGCIKPRPMTSILACPQAGREEGQA